MERNIGKTKRTKRTISTIRMMEQGQATWRGFGPSCSGKSGSTGSTGMDPGRTGKGKERNFCLEIHQQEFMSVTGHNIWSECKRTLSGMSCLNCLPEVHFRT